MSAFILKIFALVSMLIDHSCAILQISPHQIVDYNLLATGRAIGRLALPIFAFFIVEGFFKTSNLKKYIGRMHLFAIISQIPFYLTFYYQNIIIDNAKFNIYFNVNINLLGLILIIIVSYWYFILDRRYDISLLYVSFAYLIIPIQFGLNYDFKIMNDLNIFYEFGMCLIILNLLYKLKKLNSKILENIAMILAIISLVLLIHLRGNYGLSVLFLIFLILELKDLKYMQSIAISIWGYLLYSWKMLNVYVVIISAILLYYYNGKRGKELKYLFYIFYPFHLMVLALINIFILYK